MDNRSDAGNLRLHLMPRTIQPELLDSLPPDHPDALHNRRDLRRINTLLGHHRWIARTLCQLVRPGERVLELGAGTSELALRLIAAGLAVDALDLWPPPADWPATRTWHRSDLREFDRYDNYDVIMGNLIFHQFEDQELAALGARLRTRVRVIVAAEPARSRVSQWLFGAFAPLFGANRVTLHDAHVSIAGGFHGDELPRLLGLDPTGWDVHCGSSLPGGYRLVAVRRS